MSRFQVQVEIKEPEPRMKRWFKLYPLYLDSSKTKEQGRIVSMNEAVDNPKLSEIDEICKNLGFETFIEPLKRHPQDFWTEGRILVHLKDEPKPGAKQVPVNPEIPNKLQLLHLIGKELTIRHPKRATREPQKKKKGKK